MRSAIHRTKKYKAKISGEVAKSHLDRYGKTQKELFRITAAKQVEIERQVKAYMAMHGISSMYTNYYILFAKNLAKKLEQESNIEFNKWAGRGLSWYHLRNLGRASFNKRLNLYEIDSNPTTQLYLPMSEGVGTNTHDKSGLGNNGVIVGCLWQDGLLGDCCWFDGIDDTITVAHNASLNFGTGAFSIMFWFKAHDALAAYGILNKASAWNHGIDFLLPVDMTVQCKYGDGINIRTLTGADHAFNDGSWYHITVTRDGSGNAKLYANAVVDDTQIGAEDVDVANDLILGPSKGTGLTLKGKLDEVRFWNRELSATEIKNIYNAERPFHFDLLE